MSEKHTPGPWIHENRNGNDPRRTDAGREWGRAGFWGADGAFICGDGAGWDSTYEPPNAADQHVMEAAPDMLAALILACEYVSFLPSAGYTLELMRAAIAKARGA